jgi:hypothetical protein
MPHPAHLALPQQVSGSAISETCRPARERFFRWEGDVGGEHLSVNPDRPCVRVAWECRCVPLTCGYALSWIDPCEFVALLPLTTR